MSFYDYGTTDEYMILRMTHLNMIALDENMDLQPFYHRERYFIGNGVKNKGMIKFDETKPDFVRLYTPECINEVIKECKKLGFFVIYNHPCWSLENYPVYSRYKGMDAIEMLNGSSNVEGYIEHIHQVYDDLLMQGKKIGAVAGDDNHSKIDEFVCWTMIRAKDLSYKSVADALKNGDYYATNGPEIKEFYDEDGILHIRTTNAKNIVFTTNCRCRKNVYGKDGETVNEATFEPNEYVKYVRVTVYGVDGTVAYSNPYYIDE
ncbi:MAG: hypothetical protein MJ080_05640, partial [Clostridia bacterium]|nr:hypothetical protein [Clostridia bacterium]